MNGVEEALGRLTSAQQARILELWTRVEDGTLTEAEFQVAAANVVLVGNVTGYAIGAAVVRSLVEKATRLPEVVPVVPAARHVDPDRIGTALATILASEQDTVMQLARLANNEPKQAAADGSAAVIRESDNVTGWVRSLNANACQLCQWWARDGRGWPADHPFPRHTGCTCTPRPITRRRPA